MSADGKVNYMTQPFYELKGTRGASQYKIFYWEEVDPIETECGKWVVQVKRGNTTTHRGTYKDLLEAETVATRMMADIQREHGHKRAGCSIVPRET